MNTVLAIIIVLIVFAAVLWAVERNHRRVGNADRTPFGVGLEAGRGRADTTGVDRDADRIWVDLITVRAQQSATLLPRLPERWRTSRPAACAVQTHTTPDAHRHVA